MTEFKKTLPRIHNTFGGLIISSDFDTEKGKYNIAERIVSDWKFDERCKKNIEVRKQLTTV